MYKNTIRIQLLSYLCLSFLLPLNSEAQTSEYTIQSFQGDPYSELTNYESIISLTNWHPFWEYKFELEFPFPFFDSTYNSISFRYDGWGSFTDDEDSALLLMRNGWTYAPWNDTIPEITSDVRFSHVVKDNLQALVIQYTKIHFFDDPFEDSLDTYLNFQYWFYENGNIDVKFGEIHMDNTPLYAPGKGFYCYTGSGGVDTNEVCGPHLGIAHPIYKKANAIGLEGAYNDFEIYPNQYGFLTVLPPEGWVIRFKPTSLFTHNLNFEEWIISPNPAKDNIQLPQSKGMALLSDSMGKIIYNGVVLNGMLDVASLLPGLYYVKFMTNGKIYVGKFLRL